MELGPYDGLVFHCNRPLSRVAAEEAHESLKQWVAGNQRVALVPDFIDRLTVIRRSAPPANEDAA